MCLFKKKKIYRDYEKISYKLGSMSIELRWLLFLVERESRGMCVLSVVFKGIIKSKC